MNGSMSRIPSLTAIVLGFPAGRILPAIPPAQTNSENPACIACHEQCTTGIVADWRTNRHATMTPGEPLAEGPIQRRVSAPSVPDSLYSFVVGCYAYQGLHASAHADDFDHLGFHITIVVSPADGKTCHPTEA